MFAAATDLGFGEAVLLGALQGVAEFLPISSSGHLALLQSALHLEDVPVFFDVMLHVGTLLAVSIYYRRTIFGQSESVPRGDMPIGRNQSMKIALFLFLAMLPAVAAKLAFPETKPGKPHTWRNDVGDLRDDAKKHPGLVLAFLGCTSVVLLVASRCKSGPIDAEGMKWHHALAIGVAQACSAMCPGLSRSGMTISTSLLMGLRGTWAVNFTLLLSIPVTFAAATWEGYKMFKSGEVNSIWIASHWQPTVLGVAVSAFVGWASIGLLAGSVRRGRWSWFSFYLWFLIAGVGMMMALRV